MPSTTILFVRHGESEGNISGYWQGQLDTPLTAQGQEQARRVAERIRREYNGTLSALVSSDLQRARQTAEAIAQATGLPLQIDPRWRERGLGAWEGLNGEQIAERFPDEWQRFGLYEDIHCGGGETRAEVYARVEAALHDLLLRYAGQTVCVVTHGGPIRGLLTHHLGLTWAESLAAMPNNPNTSLSLVVFAGERAEVALRMDAAHLEPELLNPTTHP